MIPPTDSRRTWLRCTTKPRLTARDKVLKQEANVVRSKAFIRICEQQWNESRALTTTYERNATEAQRLLRVQSRQLRAQTGLGRGTVASAASAAGSTAGSPNDHAEEASTQVVPLIGLRGLGLGRRQRLMIERIILPAIHRTCTRTIRTLVVFTMVRSVGLVLGLVPLLLDHH